MKKNICVITGTRAEYGLLRPVMEKIREDKSLNLQIIATGMHLSPEFGLTYTEIEDDGFKIDYKVETLLSSDTTVGTAKSIGLGVIGFSEYFSILKPDIVVVLGDRTEIFAAAVAAMSLRIPIAHLYGGETGEGTIDNVIRHALSKMSILHFTSTEMYAKRVIQLGENPENVYWVGSLGVENIRRMELLEKEEIERELGFRLDERTVLITYHPRSISTDSSRAELGEILAALDGIPDVRVIFTKSNSDAQGRSLNNSIDDYVNKNIKKAKAFISLGSLRYLSTLNYVKVVVGNSSSGIIEAPSLNTYTLDIGDRQKGRLRASSVYSCNIDRKEIREKLEFLLNKERCSRIENPYEKQNTAQNVVDIIKRRVFSGLNINKPFYDL